MRTLYEIIEAAKSNEETTHEECLYALLAVEALSTFDSRALAKLAEDETTGITKLFAANYQWKVSWDRHKMVRDKSPKDWLGPSNDPTNSEYQKERAVFKRVIDKLIKDE